MKKNFTTKHESYVPVIGRDIAKRPRKLWIVVTTSLPTTFSVADYKTFI